MSDISDPGRPGRGDRRRAQKLIDGAYAAGRISSTDRAHRTQRVESAYTRGDLAIIVRDLTRPATPAAGAAAAAAAPPTAPSTGPTSGSTSGPTSLGSAIPKDQLDAMTTARAAGHRMAGNRAAGTSIDLGSVLRTSTAGGEGVRRFRRIVVIVIIGFLLTCGLGVASIVGLVYTGINDAFDAFDGTDQPTSSVNLQTAEGWTEWVAAVEEETGTTEVYDAVVYPQYASVNALADEGAMRYVYRNGSFDVTNGQVMPATTEPVDLAGIDPEMVEGLPDQTAELQSMPDYESAYLIVNRWSGEPSIMVYLQQSGKLSRWSIYDFDGAVVGGTPG